MQVFGLPWIFFSCFLGIKKRHRDKNTAVKIQEISVSNDEQRTAEVRESYLHESYRKPEPRPFPTTSNFNLRETQHTGGARPRNPKTSKIKGIAW